MDYVIHSYGGGAVLAQIFEGIARIFQTDKTFVTPMITFAMTLGGVWAMILGVFKENIGILGKKWMLPTLMIVTLLFQPKATVWIKDEVSLGAPVKVDNVPFVVAFFPSVASKIFYATTALLEESLMPASNTQSHKTGVLFGARVMGKLGSLRIEDPILLENTKAFCKQCFTKPWIMGNFLGKRKEAMEAKDILAFTKDNPAENFGIYYKDPKDSSISFKTCKAAQGVIESDMREALLTGSPLRSLTSALGMGERNKEKELSLRLHSITKDTLEYLSQETTDVHAWMKQAMMLNANKEGLDDWKESLGQERIYPELVAMQASRGIFQQSFGWLTAGEMAAEILPLLQTVLFAVLIAMIFLVFPMCLLPGGFEVLKTWILGMIWVNSWPLFWAIIHCVGMMFLSNKAGSIGGNTILSQGALGEVSLNLYAICQLLSATVPMIAWAVLSRSVQTFAGLTERLSPIGSGASLGAQMVDNTVSVDNISMGNRQIAQQAVGPSLTMGSRIADGGMTSMQGGGGRAIVQEQMSSGKMAFGSRSSIATSIAQSEQEQISKRKDLSQGLSESIMYGAQQSYEMMEAVSKGEATAQGWSTQDQESLSSAREKATQFVESNAERDSKSSSGTSRLSAGYGLKMQAGLMILGSGATTDAHLSQDFSHEMRAAKELSQDYQSSLTQGEREALQKYQSFSEEGRFTSTNDATQRLAENVRANHDEQQSLSNSIQEVDSSLASLSTSRQKLESLDSSINLNLTDDVLEGVMSDKGVTKQEAMRYLESNPDKAGAYQERAIATYFKEGVGERFSAPVKRGEMEAARHRVGETSMMSEEEFKERGDSSLGSKKGGMEQSMGSSMAEMKREIEHSKDESGAKKRAVQEKGSHLTETNLQEKRRSMQASHKESDTLDLSKGQEGVRTHIGGVNKMLGFSQGESSLLMKPKFGKIPGPRAKNKKE